MRQWLESVGLGQYAELFARHDIDQQIFSELTERDLEKLGITVGHRKRLLKARAELRGRAAGSKIHARDAAQVVEASVKPQRRQLTVLFCDLVGSTALSARLDPEDLREILHEFQRRCTEAIRRYEGHIARFMGDGLLTYFGFPVAQEDAAERAVNAGLAMVEAVSGMATPSGERIAMRVGIATGLVVVGDLIGEGSAREFELIGEAPNVAAALQNQGRANQVLVAPQTRRLLGNLFELEDLGERQLKGLEQPLRIYRVVKPSGVGSRFESRQSSVVTPFVGREAELALLQDRYERLRGEGGQIVLVSGEPGIGKSRLVMALRDRLAGENCCVISLQCSSYHTSSAWYPLVRYLEDAAGITRDTPPELRLERLEQLVECCLGEPAPATVALLAGLLSIPLGKRYPAPKLTSQQQKKRTLAALLGLIESKTKDRPVLLVFEDVHWIDPTSMELLQRLRERISGWRALAVVLFRPEFDLPWTNQPNVTALRIQRLDRLQVAALIDTLAHGQGFSEETIGQIADKTDGVPLFVEEMTTAVVERARPGQRGAPSSSAGLLSIPATLHDSLMARLDRLAHTKPAAQAAAAIGREFSLELLEAVAPMPPADVHAAVDRLLAAGLIHPSGPPANQTFAFKHALVQEEAYASLLRDERRSLHLTIAEALDGKFTHWAQLVPEVVAHHFARAGRSQSAIDYWLKAARRASERSAFAEASTHLQLALELAAALPPSADRDRLELQLQQSLGSVLAASKGFAADETIGAFRRALALCAGVPDSPQTFSALNGMIGVHVARGEFEQARDLAEDLLARAARQEDSTPRQMGHRALGTSLFLVGELAAARDHLLQALKLYDGKLHGPLALVFAQDFKVTAQGYLALALVLLGELDAGLASAREGVAHAEQLQHPHSLCFALAFQAGAFTLCGDARAAYPVADRVTALAREHEFPVWLGGGQMMRGWSRTQLGDTEAGLQEIRSSIEPLVTTGALVWVQFARYLLSQALATAGHEDEAGQLIDDTLRQIAGTRGRWYEAELHRLRGDVLRMRGADPAASEAAYREAIAVAARQGARLWQLRAATRLGDLYRRTRRSAEARAILGPIVGGFADAVTHADLNAAHDLLNIV